MYPPSPKNAKCPKDKIPQYPQTTSIDKAITHKHKVLPNVLIKLVEIKFTENRSLNKVIIKLNKIMVIQKNKTCL